MDLKALGKIEREKLIKSVSERLVYNAGSLRLLLIVMLEEKNLPDDLKIKIGEIRDGSLDWWKNLLDHVFFSPLGATTSTILAADFEPLCRATVNVVFIAQQYGEPVQTKHIMRQLKQPKDALIEKIEREKQLL